MYDGHGEPLRMTGATWEKHKSPPVHDALSRARRHTSDGFLAFDDDWRILANRRWRLSHLACCRRSPPPDSWCRRSRAHRCARWGRRLPGTDADRRQRESRDPRWDAIASGTPVFLSSAREPAVHSPKPPDPLPGSVSLRLLHRRATGTDEGGRGLQLIKALSRRRGARRTSTGICIWTEQAILAGAPASDTHAAQQDTQDVVALLARHKG
jgi:hypothetical protein